jgi:predicted Zn finger-like uncharacterized protein
VTIEVQCTSCHTRYRIDESVLPDGTPTFKCSRCGHVFNFEPRGAKRVEVSAESPASGPAHSAGLDAELRSSRSGEAKRYSADTGAEIPPTTAELAMRRAATPAATPPPAAQPSPRTAAANASPQGVPPRPSVSPSAEHLSGGRDAQSKGPAESSLPSDDADGDPLLRPLRRKFPTCDLDEGENLAFNFEHEADKHEGFEQGGDDDDQGHHEINDDFGGWQVGDADAALNEDDFVHRARPTRVQRRGQRPTLPRFNAGRGGKTRAVKQEQEEVLDADFPDETGAPVYNRRVTRSSRFFVGLFVLMIIGYAAMTILIHGSPALAAELLSRIPVVGQRFELPITPARLVALRDVHSGYIRTRDGHTALMISGNAQNVGENPLHTIQIDVSLSDHERRGVASNAVYCGGDSLSPSMAAKMTPHELTFFQRLSPPRTFVLEPSASSPFVFVFIDPPSAVSAFDLSVGAAVPAQNAVPGSGASGV